MAGESKGTRVIALVGPAGAGKTSLAEALLFAAADRPMGSTGTDERRDSSTRRANARLDRAQPPLFRLSRDLSRSSTVRIVVRRAGPGIWPRRPAIVFATPTARGPRRHGGPRVDEPAIPHIILVNRSTRPRAASRPLAASSRQRPPMIARKYRSARAKRSRLVESRSSGFSVPRQCEWMTPDRLADAKRSAHADARTARDLTRMLEQ